MKTARIFLVPGFFGFSGIGTYNYFFRVKESLQQALVNEAKSKNIEAMNFEVVECKTLPTSSIRRRANTLLEEVVSRGGLEADVLYFIGHSTGGLDVRMLLTPGINLQRGESEKEIQKLTKAAFTLSTPHWGTPLANFFTTLQGRQILRLLVTLAQTNTGRMSIFAGAQLLSVLAKIDNWTGRRDTFLDQLNRRLLSEIDRDPTGAMWKFLEQVGSDQGAILQLSQESMDLFNAGVIDLPSADYYSVLTSVSESNLVQTKWPLPSRRLATRILFKFLQKVTSHEHKHYPYPIPTGDTLAMLNDKFGKVSPQTNDGIVPLYSQLHGEILDAFASDHLDIVGHFEKSGGEPLSDWLSSGSHFNEKAFQQVWSTIASKILSYQTF